MEPYPTHFDKNVETFLYALIHIGDYEHLRKLQEGKLRFRHLSYYKKVEEAKKPHHDEDEGLMGLFQAKNVQITITPSNMPPHTLSAAGGLVGQVTMTLDKDVSIFCFHAIHSGEWKNKKMNEEEKNRFIQDLQLNDDTKKFGESVWVILDREKFNERLKNACNSKKLHVRGNFVRYLDKEKFDGPIPEEMIGFVKLDGFYKEREYRLMIESEDVLSDPYELDLGDLSDISMIIPVNDCKIDINFAKREE